MHFELTQRTVGRYTQRTTNTDQTDENGSRHLRSPALCRRAFAAVPRRWSRRPARMTAPQTDFAGQRKLPFWLQKGPPRWRILSGDSDLAIRALCASGRSGNSRARCALGTIVLRAVPVAVWRTDTGRGGPDAVAPWADVCHALAWLGIPGYESRGRVAQDQRAWAVVPRGG